MTPMKEDYLKMIFELGGTNKKVANKALALSLGVAAGSVTEMVIKLTEDKLVVHEPYAGISLTTNGVKYATELVRKHRLWETFLVNKLNYGLQDVHPEAEELEHKTSDRLADSLDDFLGHPTRCPHGGVIPDKSGHFDDVSHTSLADVTDGESVRIERFIDNHELLNYLVDLELNIEDQIIVKTHVPFEGPIEVFRPADKRSISISYKAAHNIFVQEI